MHPFQPIFPGRDLRRIPGLFQVLLIDNHLGRLRRSRELGSLITLIHATKAECVKKYRLNKGHLHIL